MNYQEIYDELYNLGYHSDKAYTHAATLCNWLDEHVEFQSILDLGCSHGWVMRRFERKPRAAGMDVSQVAVDMCRDDGLEAYQGSIAELPFKDGEFDVVISTDVFEHLTMDDAMKAVKEACRVAERFICMRIATGPDVASWRGQVKETLLKETGGEHLHLTQQPTRWWLKTFQDCLHSMGHKNRCRFLDGNMFILEKVHEHS
jgi:SAM-dependent methyltransferase